MPKFEVIKKRIRARYNALATTADPYIRRLLGEPPLFKPPEPTGLLSLPNELLCIITHSCGRVTLRSVCRRFRALIKLLPEEIALMKLSFFYARVLNTAIDNVLIFKERTRHVYEYTVLQTFKSHNLQQLKYNFSEVTLFGKLPDVGLRISLAKRPITGEFSKGGLLETAKSPLFIKLHMMKFCTLFSILYTRRTRSWSRICDVLVSDHAEFLKMVADLPMDWDFCNNMIKECLFDFLFLVTIPLLGWRGQREAFQMREEVQDYWFN